MKNQNIKVGENDIQITDVSVLNRLSKQLSPSAAEVDFCYVKSVMQYSIIITLRDVSENNVLIGMGVLIPIKKLFYFCGSVENIVVDESYRGRGLGKKLMEVLIKKSKTLGMKFVDLTSKPQREAANRLYQLAGFERRETNVYRLYN